MVNIEQEIKNLLNELALPVVFSSIVVRGNKIGFAVEINDTKITEQQITQICKVRINNNYPDYIVTIVFTKHKTANPIKTKHKFKNISNIVVISSCKGGVGKSFITVNLAANMIKLGFKVGIVDLDIYGPSIPHMLGAIEPPVIEDNRFTPVERFNIKSMSIGYLISPDKAAIWRGPMVGKALHQLLLNTNWGELDYLFIDTPPGTGDIHLSLFENYQIDNTIIVTTPQELALIDVRKTINMYQKLNIPILGIIENMSFYLDKNNDKIHIFGKGGGTKLANEFNIKLLAEIAICEGLRQAIDQSQSDYFKIDARIEAGFSEIAEYLKHNQ